MITEVPRVYVAGPSSDLYRARDVMRRLRVRGATITHDWVADIERLGGRLPGDHDERRRCAEADLQGVATADYVVLLEGAPSRGRDTERGAALVLALLGERPTVITAGQTNPDIWDELCVQAADDAEAVRLATRHAISPVALAERVLELADQVRVLGDQPIAVKVREKRGGSLRRRLHEIGDYRMSPEERDIYVCAIAETDAVLAHGEAGARLAELVKAFDAQQ